MREYKFRGKRIDSGEWLYGDLMHVNEQVLIKPIFTEPYEYDEDFDANVDPKTVGQYTGLNDKNGKEIYEGDILRCPEFYETREATETTYITTGYVEFKDGVWGFSDGGYLYEEYEGYDGNFEVISNIYESPSEATT